MRRFLLCLVIVCFPYSASAFQSAICAGPANDYQCFAASNYPAQQDATRAVFDACRRYFGGRATLYCAGLTIITNSNLCLAFGARELGHIFDGVGSTMREASASALDSCVGPYKNEGCRVIFATCDGTADSNSDKKPIIRATVPLPSSSYFPDIKSVFSDLVNMGAFGTGISFGIGIIIALLIYAKRAAIANLVVHGRLPYELPAYGEHIQCLFKRTQRINWYGRVVFGIVANLSMTKDELAKVRRYWLGRVIAFDSLRRQRQNELARMHLQLAASVKTEAKDKTALSQLWSVVKFFLLLFFYLLRAIFSFLFGFLFIRITIAKLVRGSVIESKDLVLILQAKAAIEQTATALKEYIATADTFDGSDEIHNA